MHNLHFEAATTLHHIFVSNQRKFEGV